MDGNFSIATSGNSCDLPNNISNLWSGGKHFSQFLKFVSLISLTTGTVFGNFLVILAVLTTKKLRSVNTLLITSLATADLLVGIVVLPFSISNEILDQRWIFGEHWCQIWLAVDVWLCTASIYNLVAISLDRYLAIMKPLQYRCLVTMSRGRSAVFGVWVVSFVISSPPIFLTWPKVFGNTQTRCICSPMGNTPAYILYSAFGSFFLPMAIVVFVYAKIYAIARNSTKASFLGTLNVTEKGSKRQMSGAEIPLMRVHSGAVQKSIVLSTHDPIENERQNRMTESSSDEALAASQPILHQRLHSRSSNPSSNPSIRTRLGTGDSHNYLTVGGLEAKKWSSPTLTVSSRCASPNPPSTSSSLRHSFRLSGPVSRKGSEKDLMLIENGDVLKQLLPGSNKLSRMFTRKYNKSRNAQSRLSFELKAAKTVAVVTGCFIICWLGFSVVYALQAFPFCYNDRDCIPTPVFSVVFWLGYINSALNPIIYAVFNRKFRDAFKLLLTCQCRRKKAYSVVNNLVLMSQRK